MKINIPCQFRNLHWLAATFLTSFRNHAGRLGVGLAGAMLGMC